MRKSQHRIVPMKRRNKFDHLLCNSLARKALPERCGAKFQKLSTLRYSVSSIRFSVLTSVLLIELDFELAVTLTPTEKRLQEAKFEILTSEASYLKSLTLLRTHFMNHPAFRDTNILSSQDRKTLFSFIISVQECSDRLLCDLENCWQDNIMLLGLSHSVYKHAEKYFNV